MITEMVTETLRVWLAYSRVNHGGGDGHDGDVIVIMLQATAAMMMRMICRVWE